MSDADLADTLDRDVLDLATEDDDRAACVRDLIMARCGDVLTEDEIAEAFPTEFESDPTESIWIEISERVIDCLGELEEHLEALERTINGGMDDDDERGDRRQASGRN